MPFCGADAERDSHLSAAEEKRDGALSGRAATLSTRVAAVEARRTGLARLQTPSIGPEGTERLHSVKEALTKQIIDLTFPPPYNSPESKGRADGGVLHKPIPLALNGGINARV